MLIGVNDCMSFTVSKDQSIADVIDMKNGLPKAKCTVLCVDSSDQSRIVYAKVNGDGWRITGTSEQNIYTYFKSVDTSKDNKPRWRVIQEEMKERGISKIKVTVCEIRDSGGKSPQTAGSVVLTPPPTPPKVISNSEVLPSSKKKEKVLILISCADRKNEGGRTMPGGLTFMDNAAVVPELVQKRNAMLMNHPPLHPGLLMPAWDRYDGHLYRSLKGHPNQDLINQLEQDGCIEILIVSALYGVVNKNTPIAEYDLVMTPADRHFWGNTIADSINRYYQENGFTRIVCFLTDTYYRVAKGDNSLLPHARRWPVGLRGIPNILNHVSAMIMDILRQTEKSCKSSD